MAQSQLALYNMALAAMGASYTLTSESEKSVPAETCQLFYENVRQVALRASHWNSAKRHSRLTEETERNLSADWLATDPEPGYGWSFALPADFLAARYLTTFGQFSLGYDNDKKIISANEDLPILVYTADVTDPTVWEPDLYQAIVYALAAHISRPLSGKRSLVADNLAMANEILANARAASANEIHRMFSQVAETLQARGYSYNVAAPYVYPYGSFYSGTGAPVL